jgi:hypothetical protein
MEQPTGGEAKFSKREFLLGAVAGGCALQAARWAAPVALGAPKEPEHRVSFAQSGEDIVVSTIFSHLGLPQPSYIDIGASDPIKLSNTYLFYLQGCRGVLVEPNVDLIPQYQKVRPRDTFLNVGIGIDSTPSADYYRLSEPSWNSFSKEHADLGVAAGKTIKEVVKMPLVNVNEVLAQHFPGGAPDFFSIDIEGLDLPVLKTLNFEKHRPKVICVETIILGTTKEVSETGEFLLSKGYAIRGASLMNTVFVDKAILERPVAR